MGNYKHKCVILCKEMLQWQVIFMENLQCQVMTPNVKCDIEIYVFWVSIKFLIILVYSEQNWSRLLRNPQKSFDTHNKADGPHIVKK